MASKVLLGGFAVWILLSLLILEFPNQPWNHTVSLFVWYLGIFFFVALPGWGFLNIVRAARSRSKRSQTAISSGGSGASDPAQTDRRITHWERIVAGVVVFGALLFIFIEHQIRSSVVYQAAIAQAALSGDVAVALGSPIRGGWLNTGEITESSDGRGVARLKIALSGPKGKGVLMVAATRSGEVWHIRTLEFVPRETLKSVDLLQKATSID